MNAKRFSEAMSEVDNKYYVEAANYQPEYKRAKWGVIAACLCLVIIGSFVVPYMLIMAAMIIQMSRPLPTHM